MYLDKIGISLKERRLELGYSLDQMHDKTKLSIAQLEAIERGDIAFFRDDLSYLSYFVRYYANALDLNYDDLRSELDNTISEFTESISLSQIKRQESLSTNIKSKSEHKGQYRSTIVKSKKKKIIDLRTFALIGLAVAILFSLGFVLVKYIPVWLNQDPIDRPQIVIPGEENGEEEETPDPIPEEAPSTLEIVAIDPNNYEIKGLKEGEEASLKILFTEPSWTQFRLDNVKLSEPKEATYQPGSEAIVKTVVKNQQVISIHFGRLQGNTLEINGTPIVLDETIANTIVSTLTFKFVIGG